MNTSGRARRLATSVARRAWTRAGLLVEGVALSPKRRAYAVSTRLVIHLVGCAVIGFGVGLMLWNDFGPGPLDVMIGAVRSYSGLPLTLAVWATTGTLLLVSWALGKRPGLGNVLTILTVGPLMQLTIGVLSTIDAPDAFAAKVALHVVATAVVGLGAGMNLFARLGAGTSELLASSLADRSGYGVTRVRMVCEVTWLVLGAALGGPFGVGTVIVALLIGPFVATGLRTVDTAVTSARVATRRHIEWARTPVLAPELAGLELTGRDITGRDITGPVPVLAVSAGE